MDCFYRSGYDRCGVEHIITEAGVSKGSFYHAYKSKEALALDVLEAYFENRVEQLSNGPFRSIDDPRERVLAYVDHVASVAPDLWQHGCLMGKFGAQLAHAFPAVRKRLRKLFTLSEDQLEQLFAPFVATLDDPPLDARTLAREYLCALQGAIVQGQIHGDMQRTRADILGFKRLLERL